MKAKDTSALYVDSNYDADSYRVCSYANNEVIVIKAFTDEDKAYKFLHKQAKNFNGLYRADGVYSTDIYLDEKKIKAVRVIENHDELTARDLFYKVVANCDGREFTVLYCSTLTNANGYCNLLKRRFMIREEN